MRSNTTWLAILVSLLLFPVESSPGEQVTSSLSVQSGPVNAVVIQKDDARLSVYGVSDRDSPRMEQVLLTHHRRDVAWAARLAVDAGAAAVAPAAEADLLAHPGTFWNAFTQNRFHDYAQQSTKILASPLEVDRWVKQGDIVNWRGLQFQVLDTPGYTRGSISYLTKLDGKKIAFTGDLIYGEGQLVDLYSFQDEIPDAQVRGYHGYGGRLAQLLESLKLIALHQPDIIVPARGPVIRDPAKAIETLTLRVKALYRSYLSTNALHWYFKQDRMQICADRILEKGFPVTLMPYCHYEETPEWIWIKSTSRLIISDSGHGFLLDCGGQGVIDGIDQLIESGTVTQIDGIFVTHYHDDHTDMVEAASKKYDCPVYATREYIDILRNPAAYHMPAMTSNAISNLKLVGNGQSIRWNEYNFTFQFFPGQTIYHGALLVRRKGEPPVFFIGDAFSPSGVDDYCVLNRNLVGEDEGFLLCLKKVERIKEDTWLINEHIPHVFRFNDDEMLYLKSHYRARRNMLKELFPWDNPNYGIDEQWAVFYPYGTTAAARATVNLEVRITNHSSHRRSYQVTLHLPEGMTLVSGPRALSLAAGKSGSVRVQVQLPASPGNYLVTADVHSEGMAFNRWVEALVTVPE
jgi:glyoxylase-like metal-dependent hydrolase (beta-lactamase superfamily II)